MGRFIQELLKAALWAGILAVAVAVVLRLTVVNAITIDHDGMAPTLVSGDRVLLWEGPPDLGDVAVCTHPTLPGQQAIGRVVAVGGQQLKVERGRLLVDGKDQYVDWKDTESFLDRTHGEAIVMARGREKTGHAQHDIYLRKGATFALQTQTVMAGTLFLLSDNRSYARRDSRSYGAVTATECQGTLWLRWMSAPDSPLADGSLLKLIR